MFTTTAIRRLTASSIVLLLAWTSLVHSQSEPDTLQTTKAAALRTGPSADAAVAFSVPAGTPLIWVLDTQHDGFYRVMRKNAGPQAWIAATDVKRAHEHRDGQEGDAKACVASLNECPAHGCAAEGSAEARANEMKRTRPAPGPAVELSFADFMRLQREADERVGQGPGDLSAQQHAALNGLQVSTRQVSEGDLVRVIGYIAKGGDGLHANANGESVNCMLKKPEENDFHIPLVESTGDSEFRGVVVEMIPQQRPAAWSIGALKAIQAEGAPVWVEGGLSYDKVHYVNDDAAHPLNDEPPRAALWEIHPITKFLVCRKQHCDPQNENEWSALDTK